MRPGRIAIEDEITDLMLADLAQRGWDIGMQSKESPAAQGGASE